MGFPWRMYFYATKARMFLSRMARINSSFLCEFVTIYSFTSGVRIIYLIQLLLELSSMGTQNSSSCLKAGLSKILMTDLG